MPCIILLPMTLGILGVQLVQPVSDFCTILLSMAILLPFLKKLKTGYME